MIIDSLYRYPIKSFSGEKKNSLEIYNSGKIVGDRIAAFRIGKNMINDGKWLKKNNYLSLMHIPELSKIKCKFDSELNNIYFENEKISINITDKEKIELIVGKYLEYETYNKGIALFLSPNPQVSFHDSEEGFISLLSKKSVEKLSETTGYINPKVFRSTIIIDDCDFFEEFNYVGKNLIIGDLKFQVVRRITRCNSINCNPKTAIYDRNILKVLPNINGIINPSFGIKLKLISKGGILKVGSKVSLDN